MLAVLFALATAICWGTNPLFARRAMLKVDIVTTNFYGILAGLVIITAFSFLSGDLAALPGLGPEQFLAFVVVGICTIVLGRTMYYVGITRIGAGPSISIVASSILVSTAAAFFTLNEIINLKMAVGVLMVFAGVYFISRKEA